MQTCASTYIGVQRELVTCVKSEDHEGLHHSVDGELWSDAEQFRSPGLSSPGFSEQGVTSRRLQVSAPSSPDGG